MADAQPLRDFAKGAAAQVQPPHGRMVIGARQQRLAFGLGHSRRIFLRLFHEPLVKHHTDLQFVYYT